MTQDLVQKNGFRLLIENVLPQTNLINADVSYLFDKYWSIDPREQISLDIDSWLKSGIN